MIMTCAQSTFFGRAGVQSGPGEAAPGAMPKRGEELLRCSGVVAVEFLGAH